MIFIVLFFSLLLFITLTPNAIHALLALILLFINFAVLLFMTDSVFLGFAYILVYIGAICVLFLYIILLLHMRTYNLMQRANTLIMGGLIIGFILLISFLYTATDENVQPYQGYILTDLELFSSYLFVTHQHYMLLGILLLLLALFLSLFLSTKFVIDKHKILSDII